MIGMDGTGGELKHIEIPALRGCRVRRGAVPPYTAVRHLLGLTELIINSVLTGTLIVNIIINDISVINDIFYR